MELGDAPHVIWWSPNQGNRIQLAAWTGSYADAGMSNMCIDLPDGNGWSGAPLQMWQCTWGPNQQFAWDGSDEDSRAAILDAIREALQSAGKEMAANGAPGGGTWRRAADDEELQEPRAAGGRP